MDTRWAWWAIAVALSSAPTLGHAQYAEDIRTARPGQAMGTYTLGARVFQVQQGITFRNREVRMGSTQTVLSNNVFRLGLTEHLEVSGVVRYQVDRSPDVLDGDHAGVSSLQLGARYNILVETAKAPGLAIQTRLLLRAGARAFRQAGVGNTTTVSVGKRLGGRGFSGLANLGLVTMGIGARTTATYALQLRYRVSPTMGVMVEGFGVVRPFDLNLDAGIGYFLSRDVKLDLAVGLQSLGHFESDPRGLYRDYFVTAGVGWRLDWRKE